MITKKELRIGYQIHEYRKIKMRWCKLEKMFDIPVKELKRLQCLYRASLEDKIQEKLENEK
jgi:hypothetical protein